MINISAKNFKLTDGIKNYVNGKLGKFEKFTNEGEAMNVVLESNKYGNKAEVSFRLANKPLRASAIDDDMYVAIDILVDKLSRIIEKNNSKNKDRTSIRHTKPVSMTELIQNEKEYKAPRIVKRKAVSSKPMFEGEAIEQMELLDHRSFIFHNASTGTICMLYKRHDGDYGILETNHL